MTDEELKQIEERAAKATPGPWVPDFRDITLREATPAEAERMVLADAKSDFCLGAEIALRAADGGAAWLPCPTRSTFLNRDALFIAAARSDVPALVSEVRKLKALLVLERLAHTQELEDAMVEVRRLRNL